MSSHPSGKSSLPLVSIVVPSYGSQEEMGACLSSLLKQEYPKNRFEVIVVASGTDSARGICERFNIGYYYKPELGSPGSARNYGVGVAKGDIVAFTDIDCVAPKDWLRRIVEDFEAFPEVVGVFGFYRGGRSLWERIWNEEFDLSSRRVGRFESFMEGNAAFKREVFERGYRFGVYPRSEGWVLMQQVNEVGYKTLRDYSLRVLHSGFPYTFRKIFNTGRLYYYNSKAYFGDFKRAVSFSLFLIASLSSLAFAFANPMFVFPFLLANLTFSYFVYKTHRAPIRYLLLMFIPLLAARWTHWLGFTYEWLSISTLKRGLKSKKGHIAIEMPRREQRELASNVGCGHNKRRYQRWQASSGMFLGKP